MSIATTLVRLDRPGRIMLASEVAALPSALEGAAGARRFRAGEAVRGVIIALGRRAPDEARRAAASLAASDHWRLWHVWLSWREDPDASRFSDAAVADAVLRDCAVCAEVRLDVL